MLLAVLMFLPSLKVALEARDSKSPSGTTHAPSALEENHLGSQTSQLPWLCSYQTQHTHVNTHLMQLADCISTLQLGLVIAGTTNHQCPSTSVPCKHSGWDVITLKTISVKDHYQPPHTAVPWKVTPWKWYEGEVGRKEECSVYFLLTFHFICIQCHV